MGSATCWTSAAADGGAGRLGLVLAMAAASLRGRHAAGQHEQDHAGGADLAWFSSIFFLTIREANCHTTQPRTV